MIAFVSLGALGFFLFPSLIKLSLSQPVSFLAFAVPLLSLVLLGKEGRERVSSCVGAWLLAGVSAQHLLNRLHRF